ncbi:MAG: hypothetical protein JWQ40_598 [Segetibacter sp.]|nr:hypothetical protein [Segetibacter sp.]
MPARGGEGTRVRYKSGIENTKYKSATQEKHNSSGSVWPIKIILKLTRIRLPGVTLTCAFAGTMLIRT